MTTIAYSKGWLAADTRVSIGNYHTKTEKLYKIEGLGVLGLAGSTKICNRVARWWASGCEGDPPEASEKEQEDGYICQGILATKEGLFLLEDGVFPIVIKADYLAVGSGSDYAIAAMEMGKSAKEAVAEAAKHDIYTGGDIDEVDCCLYYEVEEEPKKVKKKKKGKKK